MAVLALRVGVLERRRAQLGRAKRTGFVRALPEPLSPVSESGGPSPTGKPPAQAKSAGPDDALLSGLDAWARCAAEERRTSVATDPRPAPKMAAEYAAGHYAKPAELPYADLLTAERRLPEAAGVLDAWLPHQVSALGPAHAAVALTVRRYVKRG